MKGIEDLNVRWQMRDNATGGRILTDRFELVIIELPKAKRIYEKKNDNKISQWMMFLDNPNSKEVAKIVDKNEDIKNAREELKQVSGNYELRRIAELKEKYIRDEAAALEYAMEKGQKEGMQQGIEQGIEEGIEEGIEQGSREATNKIVKKMLQLNVELEVISESTGLAVDEILKLK